MAEAPIALLGELWLALEGGSWSALRVVREESRFGLEIQRRAPASRPLRPQASAIFRRWLATGNAKATAGEFEICRAKLQMTLKAALVAMGLDCPPRRSPLMLALLAHAPSTEGSALLEGLGSRCRIECGRDDRLFPKLSRSLRGIARDLIDGVSPQDIALRRGTALRTVSNQTRTVFRSLGVSGVSELRSAVARSLLDLSKPALSITLT